MHVNVKKAGAVAVTASFLTTMFSAQGAGAAVAEHASTEFLSSATRFISQPVIQPLPETQAPDDQGTALDADEPSAETLHALVSQQPHPDTLSPDLKCLAGAIYFEARGESLAGQLAVGRVIVARSQSSRFPDSYCGVVFQRSQFSFVRGNAMPRIKLRSAAWRKAVAVAQIAHSGSWRSPVEGALFFHATRVSPGWRLTRLARVDNHVFYR